jgi:phosphopantetheinyl transferase
MKRLVLLSAGSTIHALRGNIHSLLIILCLMNITTYSHDIFPAAPPLADLFPTLLSLENLAVRAGGDRGHRLVLVDLSQVEKLLLSDPAVALRCLAPREQEILAGYRFAKRRREWLGGRLAVKAALLLLQEQPLSPGAMTRLSVLPDAHGRPSVQGSRGHSISISHSGEFAVGMACREKSCGVDIQEISSRLDNLTPRFAAKGELRLLEDSPTPNDHDTRLTMLWAAKEALKKSLLHDQPSIFSGICVQQIQRINDHCWSFACRVHEQAATVSVHACSSSILAHTHHA